MSNPLATHDYTPGGLLFPYVEGSRKVFRCPNGFDWLPGSPTFGKELQVSYALNYVTNGPAGMNLVHVRNGTSNVLLGWEHSNVPACAYQSAGSSLRVPWPFDAPDAPRHYPPRHNNTFNVVYCDGHLSALTTSDVPSAVFLAQ